MTLGSPANDIVRSECVTGYEWPAHLDVDIRALRDLFSVVDNADLGRVRHASEASGSVVVTLLSSEYLGLVDLWVSHCARHRLNFAIVACDDTTESELRRRAIPYVRVRLHMPESQAHAGFVSRQGFTAKALAIIGLKFPLVRYFLSAGLDVTLADIDAVFLQDPRVFFQGDAEILFQRVAYFPKALARLWGFVACSGFVHFKASPTTLAFLDTVVRMQSYVASDQIALNLGLLDWNVNWGNQRPGDGLATANVLSNFVQHAEVCIDGFAPAHGLVARALPPINFWRHSSVPFANSDVFIAHPNAPKDSALKTRAFDDLGIVPWRHLAESEYAD